MPNPQATGLNKKTNIDIHIVFEEETEFGTYKDALVMPSAEFEVMSDAQLSAKIRERIDRWRLRQLHNKPKK